MRGLGLRPRKAGPNKGIRRAVELARQADYADMFVSDISDTLISVSECAHGDVIEVGPGANIGGLCTIGAARGDDGGRLGRPVSGGGLVRLPGRLVGRLDKTTPERWWMLGQHQGG